MWKQTVRLGLTALTLGLTLTSAPGHAQQAGAWPSKPVTIVIVGAPGSRGDIEARVYAEKLRAAFGQPFIVDNKLGADGSIGAAYVAKASPDGHTLLAASTSFVVAPATNPNLPYDALKDLAPISLISTAPVVLVANPAFPPNNIKEYIAYAKANPGKILFATSGGGGVQHLTGVWLHDAIGADANFIHYKSSASANNDLLAGRINVQPRSLAGLSEYMKTGKLKVIASLASKRDPSMPDVATAQEAELKDVEQPNFYGFLTSSKTDRAIINRLSAEMAKIVQMPDVRAKLEPLGLIMVGSTPEEFSRYLTTQINAFKRVVKEKNIVVE